MHQSDSAGRLLALAGFVVLPLGDATVKTMAGDWPPTAIAALRYVFGAMGLSAMLLATRGPAAFRPPRTGLQVLRGLSVAVSTCAFFAAVSFMPLAEATSITFVNPIITALLAGAVLKEPVRRETWAATVAAFAGVVMVLRPNFSEVGWAALLPLIAALSFSGLVLANRVSAGLASALAMQVYVAVGGAVFLVLATVAGHMTELPRLQVAMPDWTVVARCAFVAITASTGHWLIYLGTTRAGAATIAPMSYGQLIMAVTLGWLAFGEHPDLIAMLGIALIMGAGVFLWLAGAMREPVESE